MVPFFEIKKEIPVQMIGTRRRVVALSLALAAFSVPCAIAQTAICKFPPVVAPGWYDWINDPGVPASARRELLPLYQQLDYLQRLRLPVALLQVQDRAWDFLAAAGAAVGSKASILVAESATGKTRPANAATSADSPEALGWDIGSDIRSLESQIKTIRHKYNLDTTIGPAEKPFNVSSVFSNDGVKAWLQKSDCGQKLLERTVPPPKESPPCDWPSKTAQCMRDWTPCAQACRPADKDCVEACNRTLNACSDAAYSCLHH
jgi:hypothetical protein